MDWPMAAIILGIIVSLVALFLKYAPSRNGSADFIPREVYSTMHAALEQRLADLRMRLDEIDARLVNEIRDLKVSIEQVNRRINEISDRMKG